MQLHSRWTLRVTTLPALTLEDDVRMSVWLLRLGL